jgi:hypothetical protein|tara:strand:- start:206 stop:706 length:501 start_codon:yes stop_codon:yes gene_type:complete
MPVELNTEMLDAPIPGQSLTNEPGAYPWEKPPKLNTVDEVISNYLPLFNNKDIVIDLLNQMEAGIPITSMVSLITKSGTMAGLHSIDTGLLASPVLVEMLISVADASDVDYVIGTEKVDSVKPRMSSIRATLKDFAPTEDVPEMVEEEPMKELPEEPMGMMARREV